MAFLSVDLQQEDKFGAPDIRCDRSRNAIRLKYSCNEPPLNKRFFMPLWLIFYQLLRETTRFPH